MSQDTSQPAEDDLRPEYDLSELKPAPEQRAKRLKRIGMRTIGLNSYQPDQKVMEGFEERVRKDIERGSK